MIPQNMDTITANTEATTENAPFIAQYQAVGGPGLLLCLPHSNWKEHAHKEPRWEQH